MKPRDIALAVAVTAIWGVNFVVIEAGLDHFPPLLFSALRFTLAAVPAIFFAGRPRVPWRWIVAVALVLGVTKFSLLFAGMAAGMPAGLSSLVLQSQAVFTILFAVLLLRERPRPVQIAGLVLALGGVGLVATRMAAGAGAFLLIVGAAAAWGLSNVATRKASPPDTLRFMIWVSAFAAPPLIVLSLLIDGPAADLAALRAIDGEAVAALLYIALLSTLAGFAGWGHLLRRYGASTVAPFSMLVPFFGMASAALVLGERIHAVDVAGGVLVVGGILLGLLAGPSRRAPRAAPARPGLPAAAPRPAAAAPRPAAAAPRPAAAAPRPAAAPQPAVAAPRPAGVGAEAEVTPRPVARPGADRVGA